MTISNVAFAAVVADLGPWPAPVPQGPRNPDIDSRGRIIDPVKAARWVLEQHNIRKDLP